MSTGLCLLMVTVCLAQVADFTETGHQSINQKQVSGYVDYFCELQGSSNHPLNSPNSSVNLNVTIIGVEVN